MKLRRYFDPPVLAIVAAAILVGLSVSSASLAEAPIYEFRGFDSNSTCEDVKDREISDGGLLSSYEKKEGARLWAYYINSNLLGFDTIIEISCGSNRHATSIRYQVVYSDGLDLDDAFARLYSATAEVFGRVPIETDSMGISASFLCKKGFLISLNLVRASTMTPEGPASLNEAFLVILSDVKYCE